MYPTIPTSKVFIWYHNDDDDDDDGSQEDEDDDKDDNDDDAHQQSHQTEAEDARLLCFCQTWKGKIPLNLI